MAMTRAIFVLSVVLCVLSVTGDAQTRRKKTAAKKPAAAKTVTSETNTAPVAAAEPDAAKRNERPAGQSTVMAGSAAAPQPISATETQKLAEFSYEFSQPNFTISRIAIEHDDSGIGTITFLRKDFGEPLTDPVKLSPVTMGRIRGLIASLDFVNSTEEYQHQRDYSHLGTMKFTVRKDGRERTAAFNWTDNKHARALADEYRKIGNEYIWRFDILLSRENQPLESPKIIARLDAYLRRNEISDPPQLLGFLAELSNDERLPLITRNHADRLLKQIEKQSQKAKK